MLGNTSRSEVVIAAIAMLLFASTVAIAEEPQKVQEVVVTGSRIARPNLESPVPVTSLSGDELFQNGDTAVGDTLNDLPSLRSTFSQSNSSRFLGTTGLNLLDLRGLGTQRTLVLVNGRRHVGSDILVNAVSPDINTFPTDLIDRIDIVTGGNSAVYGSDAIAGVVNFVLKKDFEGLRVRGQAGESSKHDAGDYYASVLAGTNFLDGRGNIAANLEFARQTPFFASDRSSLRKVGQYVMTDTDPSPTENGPDHTYYDDVRSVTFSNNGNILVAPNGKSGRAPCGRDRYGNPYSCSYLFQPNGSLVPQTGTRVGLAPFGNFVGGNGTSGREGDSLAIFPQLKRVSFNVLSHLTVADEFEPFLEAKYVRSDSLRFGSPAFFQGQTNGGDPREEPRFDNPFLTDTARGEINAARADGGLAPLAGSDRFALRRNLLDLGPRQEAAARETARVVLGVDGKFASDWSYDVSVNYGQFTEDTKVLGNLDVQRFFLAMDSTRNAQGNIVCRSQIDPAAAVGRSGLNPQGTAFSNSVLPGDVAGCVPLNPFGFGNITPAMRNYLLQNTTSRGKISQFVADASVSGSTKRWFSLPGGPIGVAFGVEHRTETNFFKSDDLVASGLTFYNALPLFNPPTFAVNEVFTELRLPVLTDKPFFRDLTIDAAGRYAAYNGSTGGVFAHNYGLEWAPFDSLRFRVGKARAVRAPNLSDLYTQQTQNFAGVVDPCSARNIGTGSSTRAANCAAAGVPKNYDFVYNATLQLVSGGNPNLKAETSDSLTAGFVFQPQFTSGFSMSVDYFHITVNNVITAPVAQDILNACYDAKDLNNQFCSLFQRAGPGGGPHGEEPYRIIEGSLQQIVLNYAKSISAGVDVEFSYNHDIGIGRLGSRLVYTHTLRRDDFQNPTDPNRPNQILTELGDPKDAFNFNTDFKRGSLTIGYELRYIGKMVVDTAEDFFSVGGQPPQDPDWADRKYYPSIIYHDIRAGYDFGDALNLYAGVNNVTDKPPPLGLTTTGAGSGIYDARGRFFFVGAKYNVGGSFKH